MPETVDILKSTPQRIKKEIDNILRSYSNQWDILSELLQNSVDSIRRWNNTYNKLGKTKNHSILVEIDSSCRKIRIRDSGTGFNPKEVPDLLAPHGTDKDNLPDEVGEKGVGLTYTMFSSNYFSLSSKSEYGETEAKYEGGLSWLKVKSKTQPPLLEYTTLLESKDPLDSFTDIVLEDVSNLEDDLELFDWNTNQLEHILRTKTAVGNFKKLLGKEPLDIDITLRHINPDKHSDERKILFSYQAPNEFFEAEKVFDLNKEATALVSMTEGAKKEKLAGKILKKTGTYSSITRTLDYIVYFVAGGNPTWDKIQEDYYEDGESSSFKYLSRPGICVFTKGMPTGIRVPAPHTGSSGYWSSIFLFVNADYLNFDLGRKSLNPNTVRVIQDAASQIFSDICGVAAYVSGEKPTPVPPGGKKKKKNLLKELQKLPDLNISEICYQKYPNKQEAAVAAIFHEMLGAGLLKGYHGIGWSYGAKYDMYANYTGLIEDLVGANQRQSALSDNDNDPLIDDEITIEFKYKAESVLSDIKEGTKEFQEIDLIVCWEVDVEAFGKQSVIVKPINPVDAYYNGANYVVIFPTFYNLGEIDSSKYIIALKDIIQGIQRKQR